MISFPKFVSVKRALSIFFLIIFLSTTSIGNQLLKLPDLIEHFVLHQDEHDDHAATFFDFLKEHYSFNSSHDKLAHHSHKNLPFKGFDAHAPNIVILDYQVNNFTFLNTVTEIKEKPVSFSNSFIPPANLEGIWQPPRFC